jgi:hypothetical protein
MRFDDSTADREADAHSVLLARHERLKQSRRQPGVDPRPLSATLIRTMSGSAAWVEIASFRRSDACIASIALRNKLLNLDLVDQDKIDVRVEAEPDLDILDPRGGQCH